MIEKSNLFNVYGQFDSVGCLLCGVYGDGLIVQLVSVVVCGVISIVVIERFYWVEIGVFILIVDWFYVVVDWQFVGQGSQNWILMIEMLLWCVVVVGVIVNLIVYGLFCVMEDMMGNFEIGFGGLVMFQFFFVEWINWL